MQKLFNADLLDIVPTDRGFIYACKENLDGKEAVGFFNYSAQADLFERIPVNTYIIAKYGEDGFRIAKQLGDFVTCILKPLSKNQNIASYSNGTIKMLDSYGEITDIHNVAYSGSEASYAEVVNDCLWLTVPDENAVIKYSPAFRRIEFRIGSKSEKAFSRPVFSSCYDNYLYVCNAASYKIKTISLESYSVKDYAIFNEPVHRYFRMNGKEYVMLNSGLYTL